MWVVTHPKHSPTVNNPRFFPTKAAAGFPPFLGSLELLVLLVQAKRTMIAKQVILPTNNGDEPIFYAKNSHDAHTWPWLCKSKQDAGMKESVT